MFYPAADKLSVRDKHDIMPEIHTCPLRLVLHSCSSDSLLTMFLTVPRIDTYTMYILLDVLKAYASHGQEKPHSKKASQHNILGGIVRQSCRALPLHHSVVTVSIAVAATFTLTLLQASEEFPNYLPAIATCIQPSTTTSLQSWI